jgi:hypothetical protein
MRRFFARFRNDDAALSTFPRLLVLYFAIGAGVVFASSTYCDLQRAQNITGGCGIDTSKIDVGGVANSTKLPSKIETGFAFGDAVVNAAAWALGGVLSALSTAVAVISWPAAVFAAVPNFPPLLGQFVGYSFTLLIVIAGIAWLRGVQ